MGGYRRANRPSCRFVPRRRESSNNPPPPFFLSWGSRDFPHLITQAQKMEQALRDAGGETAVLELEDCDHLQANLACGDPDGPWAGRVMEWIRGH